MQSALSDTQLLSLLDTSPQEGMAALFKQYTGLVWHVISQYLADVEDRKECADNVFLAFSRARDQVDLQRGTVASYLGAIARNQAVSRYRRSLRTGNGAARQSAEYAVLEETDPILQAEDRMDLEEAMAHLSPEDAEIIRRKYYAGETIQEIAASMGMPYETVKKRHQRSLGKLKRLLTAGLVLLLLALLAACAYIILRHFGIVAGLGVTGGEEIPAYLLEEPAVLETADGVYTVPNAIYMNGTLYLELTAEIPGYGGKLRENHTEENPYTAFADLEHLDVVCGGQETEAVCSRDWRDDGYYLLATIRDAPPPMDGAVQISFLGRTMTVPLQQVDADSPEMYSFAAGEYGALAAVQRKGEAECILEVYSLPYEDLSISPGLVLDQYRQGDIGDITLMGADGTVIPCAGSWYNTAVMATDTISFWKFGTVEPGQYTLRIPFVHLSAPLTEAISIPLDLEHGTWSPEPIQLPHGTLSVVDCRRAEAEEVPAKSPLADGWILTLQWDSPNRELLLHPRGLHADLSFPRAPLTELVVSAEWYSDVISGLEDGRFQVFLAVNETQSADESQVNLLLEQVIPYRWEHTFEIPVTIE